ncbi:MAG: hypothetical protein LBG19_05745 [Prevotellaceae bacterium]|jgi:hypothetical protein|nr:hypothetical protein [Prevotellaceae bacterium]
MKHSKLVFLVFLLIFENPAPFDTKNTRLTSSFLYEPIKSQTRSFVDENGVAYKFIPTKPYDTLVIKSVNRNTVELSHYYHHYIYAEHMLLQADDTVKIRYDGTDKPTYTSLYSDENNRLYGLRRELFDEFMGDDPERMNEQRRGYALNLQRQKILKKEAQKGMITLPS